MRFLTLAAFFTLFLANPKGHAQTPPSLQASEFGSGLVLLAISSPTQGSGFSVLLRSARSHRLRLARSCDAARFRTFARVTQPPAYLEVIDVPPYADYCEYQATTVIRGARRRVVRLRSESQVVFFDDSISPPPVTPPTPAPPLPLPTPVALYSGQRECESGFESQLRNALNSQRARAGLAQLALDTRLNLAARLHSREMAASGELSHSGWLTHLNAVGFFASSMAQNVASYAANGAVVVDLWMTSSGHRDAMLDPDSRILGVGCVKDSSGMRWWNAYFASRP